MGNFFKKIGSWFKAAFTGHNLKAVAVTVERVGVVAGDIAAQNYAGAAVEATQVVDAAKSFHVDGFSEAVTAELPAEAKPAPIPVASTVSK